MIKPTLPANDDERVAELHRLHILDTKREQAYDDLLTIAAGICNTPMGAVTLIDSHRQWFKSELGLGGSETSRDEAFCAHAINEPEKLLIVPDVRLDVRFHDNPVARDAGFRFYAGAPLVTHSGHAMGTLCVMDRIPRELTPFQRQALVGLSRQVGALFDLRRAYRTMRHQLQEKDWYERTLSDRQKALEAENAELTQMTRTDSLTGLTNRRGFEQAMSQAMTTPGPLCLAVIDIDHFKKINDTYGHPVGDTALQALGTTLRQFVHSGLVARLGGEEFGWLMPMGAGEAFSRCKILRSLIAQEHPGLSFSFTASIGLAERRDADTTATLFARADKALYAAKEGGRNRVNVAP